MTDCNIIKNMANYEKMDKNNKTAKIEAKVEAQKTNKIIKIFKVMGIKDEEKINKTIYEWARGAWVLIESKFRQ